MKILDPGHTYLLRSFDGGDSVKLTFVKRCGYDYPGNDNKYSGTLTQEVLRALIERTGYVDNQKPCWQNKLVRILLIFCLYLLELRHLHKKGIKEQLSFKDVHLAHACPSCGHIKCLCLQNQSLNKNNHP